MACFEQNRHTQISGEDSILSHYDITICNDIVRDVHCDIIMGHDVVMGAYHNVTMHTDVVRTLIYYVLLLPIMIFLFS